MSRVVKRQGAAAQLDLLLRRVTMAAAEGGATELRELDDIDGLTVKSAETNIVFVDVADGRGPALLDFLKANGVLATGLAIGVQAKVQPRIKPTHVALLFALQPLFAALAGWMFLDDRLGATQWIGGGMIVSAVVLAARDQS